MVNHRFLFLLFSALFPLFISHSYAQFPIVSAEQVKAWMESGRKFVLIDARLPEEYEKGHIPGAINIPAERMAIERARLPKDKSTLLVFYCRGVG